jgi:hypothetical protein
MPWRCMEELKYSSTTLNTGLDGCEWSDSHPCHFTSTVWMLWRKEKPFINTRNQSPTAQFPSLYCLLFGKIQQVK